MVRAYEPNQTRRSFTLTEMMVAVVVLIVVIIATSKIFGTASQITSVGTATANLMLEAAAIERQIRDDVAKMTNEGFFAIRCVAVRNDIRGGGVLLNPNLPPSSLLRCDQLVFFANGVESSQVFRSGQFGSRKGQGIASRIYYGHAFQLLQGQGVNGFLAHDPNPPATAALTPWYPSAAQSTTIAMSRTNFDPNAPSVFSFTTQPPIDATQPEARQWLLARQQVMLVDDDDNPAVDNSKTVYLGEITTARSIFIGAPWGNSREIRNGRLDAAASDLNEIRRWVLFPTLNPVPALPPATGTPQRPWNEPGFAPGDQRSIISRSVYYPRAERRSPSMHRIDQALNNHVISGACSSFSIDWTYENGTGFYDGTYNGIEIPREVEHPWFGLDEVPGFLDEQDRGVKSLGAYIANPSQSISPMFPENIEASSSIGSGSPPQLQVYEALFGYNQTVKVNGVGSPDASLGYTPFPSAIRITMTLHDPAGKLEGGRQFQFVINLPRHFDRF